MHLPSFILAPRRRLAQQRLRALKQYSLQQLEEQARRDCVWEARDFVEGFVRARWGHLMHSIRVQVDMPLEQVRALGRLPQADGTAACRRLVSAPVVNDEIGYSLWAKLAEDVRKAEEREVTVAEAQRVVGEVEEVQKPKSRSFSFRRPAAEGREVRRRHTDPGVKVRKNSTVNASASSSQKHWGLEKKRRPTCVFCHDHGDLCPVLPEGIYPPEPDLHQRRGSLHGRFGRGEEAFWVTEGQPERDIDAERSDGKTGIPVRRLVSAAKDFDFQKALVSLGESLADGYGYGHRSYAAVVRPARRAC